MRIILFTGKGGVGKTSISAASALKAAQLGYKTLVMSLDAAHSLSDSFDLDKRLLDHEKGALIQLEDQVWLQEVDVQEEIQKNWGEVYKYLAMLLNTSGLDEILAEELAILPGMEEVSALLYLNQYTREKAFDVIMLDCAPTGESLRFISLPTTLEWYMRKVFKLEKNLMKVMRPVMSTMYSVPLPEDSYFESIQSLYDKLQGVDKLLNDPAITTVRLITNPEKIVIKETQRAFMYFCLYGLSIDAIIVNRILPPQVSDEYFVHWLNTQDRYLAQLEEYFTPVPVQKVNLFKDEIIGKKDLSLLAETLYPNTDPTQVFYNENPYVFLKENDQYQVRIKLPFVSKADIDLSKSADELIIRIGNFKKNLILPRRIASTKPSGAKVEGNTLTVFFKTMNGE
jgi:arsenite-transporting ATPase